jgi:hypothetical protein
MATFTPLCTLARSSLPACFHRRNAKRLQIEFSSMQLPVVSSPEMPWALAAWASIIFPFASPMHQTPGICTHGTASCCSRRKRNPLQSKPAVYLVRLQTYNSPFTRARWPLETEVASLQQRVRRRVCTAMRSDRRQQEGEQSVN